MRQVLEWNLGCKASLGVEPGLLRLVLEWNLGSESSLGVDPGQ